MRILKLFAIFLWLPAISQAATVDFNVPTFPGDTGRLESYTENGIKLEGAFLHTDTGLSGNPDNGTAFLQYADFSSVNIGSTSGQLFDLVSVDLAAFNIDYSQPMTIEFVAQKQGSVMVSQIFTIDGSLDFDTFYFGAEFNDVIYAYVSDSYKSVFSMDNLNVHAVPVPAAFWLFASGLIGLFRFSKRSSKVIDTKLAS